MSFASWDQGEANGYLSSRITSQIFQEAGRKDWPAQLIDEILRSGRPKKAPACDFAKRDGTASADSDESTSRSAMRDLSVYATERQRASAPIRGPWDGFEGERGAFLTRLGRALLCRHDHSLTLRAWRSWSWLRRNTSTASRFRRRGPHAGGAARIIRAALLDDLCAAFQAQPGWKIYCSTAALSPQVDGASGGSAPGGVSSRRGGAAARA